MYLCIYTVIYDKPLYLYNISPKCLLHRKGQVWFHMQGPGPCTKMSLRSQKTNGSGEPYIFCSDDYLISRISKLVTCRVGSNAQQWRMQSFHLRGHSAAPGRDFARACAGDGSASATHVGSSCWIVKTLVWPWMVNEWCTITYNYKASFETTFKGMVSEPLYPSPPCS